jgi:membrane protein
MRLRFRFRPRSFSDFVHRLLERFAGDHCDQAAASLTFTTLLALVPLFTIAFALIAAFPVFEEWSDAFKIFLLTSLVPEVSGKVITVYMQQFADNAGKLTAIGLVFLVVTALILMLTVERVFNVIWRVRRPRPLLQRLVIYWAVLTIGPLLIGASLSITSWLLTRSLEWVPASAHVGRGLLGGLPFLLTVIAFGLLYQLIPNRQVAPLDAWLGGLAAASVFELMKYGFGLYVANFPTYTLVYGAFATIPIFLLWVYLSWVVVLWGAVAVAILPDWRAGVPHGDLVPGRRFERAVRVLQRLDEARSQGGNPTSSRLAAFAGMSEDEVEAMLERMQAAGWVRRIERGTWVLVRDLAVISVADVYHAFVFDLGSERDRDDAIGAAIRQLAARLDGDLALSVKDLILGESDARSSDAP